MHPVFSKCPPEIKLFVFSALQRALQRPFLTVVMRSILLDIAAVCPSDFRNSIWVNAAMREMMGDLIVNKLSWEILCTAGDAVVGYTIGRPL